LSLVDAFAGGGRYACGTPGSPIIFLEQLENAVQNINQHRSSIGFNEIEFECLLILNDEIPDVVKLLRENVAPLQIKIRETTPNLHLKVEFLSDKFEIAYPKIKNLLEQGKYRNVLINLDQCGHGDVERKTIVDIMRSFPSAEIFFTFAIETLLSFLQKSEPKILRKQLDHIISNDAELDELNDVMMSKQEWLGAAERIVYSAYKNCAPFVSPFSINNPKGWRYWLIHFANSFRARQVYNNILHYNSSEQAHFGRAGLDMLSYDAKKEDGALYLFDLDGRNHARSQLFEEKCLFVAQILILPLI
jgi:three-Cys-motif partner protein